MTIVMCNDWPCLCLLIAGVVMALRASALAQPEINYDESKVPRYTLPDPLVGRRWWVPTRRLAEAPPAGNPRPVREIRLRQVARKARVPPVRGPLGRRRPGRQGDAQAGVDPLPGQARRPEDGPARLPAQRRRSRCRSSWA